KIGRGADLAWSSQASAFFSLRCRRLIATRRPQKVRIFVSVGKSSKHWREGPFWYGSHSITMEKNRLRLRRPGILISPLVEFSRRKNGRKMKDVEWLYIAAALLVCRNLFLPATNGLLHTTFITITNKFQRGEHRCDWSGQSTRLENGQRMAGGKGSNGVLR